MNNYSYTRLIFATLILRIPSLFIVPTYYRNAIMPIILYSFLVGTNRTSGHATAAACCLRLLALSHQFCQFISQNCCHRHCLGRLLWTWSIVIIPAIHVHTGSRSCSDNPEHAIVRNISLIFLFNFIGRHRIYTCRIRKFWFKFVALLVSIFIRIKSTRRSGYITSFFT
jgi:hypothetical protein